MSPDVAPADYAAPTRRSARSALLFLGILIAVDAFAGGADVSTDAIYSDDVVLATPEGVPLDVNGDGNVDLAVAANRSGPNEGSRYYLGNGDGSFSAGASLTAGASSEIVPGDLNGDGILDLVQARRDLSNLFYFGNGTGFGSATDVAADTDRTLSLALGDLDLDGDLDVVAGNGKLGGVVANPAQPNRFYLNDFVPGGSVAFAGADISADADDTRSIALADLDGDGDLDVIAGNDETTTGSNRVYLNQFVESGNTAVSFAAGIDFGDPDDQTNKLLVGDLDGDSDLDIVALNNTSTGSVGINRFFINDLVPGGVFALGAGTDISADTDSTGGGALADFDGDGDLDVAVTNTLLLIVPGESPRNRLYLNQVATPGGAVSFASAIDISTDEDQSRELAAFDIDADGHIDIVVGNQDQPDRRYLNNGTADPFTNLTPVIDAQAGPLETDEETALTLSLDDVTVTDPDNLFPDDFTLAVQSGSGYAVAGNTITPDPGFSGELTVPVIVNDGSDDSAAFDLSVTVNNTVNNPPAFTSTPVTAASVGVAYAYNVTASDPDGGDVLAISATSLPSWLSLTDNGDGTATLSGTPAANDSGMNMVSLRVQDAAGAFATQDFTITVAGGAGTNNPPSFTSAPVTAATANTAYGYAVTAGDADADPLTITASTLPSWLVLTDNGDGTATLSGTPLDGDVGSHAVSLEVSDGTATAIQGFNITVSEEPADTTPPVIALIGPATVTVNLRGTYNDMGATAVDDVDGDLTDEIMTSSDVNTAATGTYTVAYDVSDSAGNAAATVTRTVIVAVPVAGDAGGGGTGLLSLLALLALVSARSLRRQT